MCAEMTKKMILYNCFRQRYNFYRNITGARFARLTHYVAISFLAIIFIYLFYYFKITRKSKS